MILSTGLYLFYIKFLNQENVKNNKPNSFSSCIRLLNIGTSNTISINKLIFLIETNLGINQKNFLSKTKRRC